MVILVKYCPIVRFHEPNHDLGYIVLPYNSLIWSSQPQHLKVEKCNFLPQEGTTILFWNHTIVSPTDYLEWTFKSMNQGAPIGQYDDHTKARLIMFRDLLSIFQPRVHPKILACSHNCGNVPYIPSGSF